MGSNMRYPLCIPSQFLLSDPEFHDFFLYWNSMRGLEMSAKIIGTPERIITPGLTCTWVWDFGLKGFGWLILAHEFWNVRKWTPKCPSFWYFGLSNLRIGITSDLFYIQWRFFFVRHGRWTHVFCRHSILRTLMNLCYVALEKVFVAVRFVAVLNRTREIALP